MDFNKIIFEMIYLLVESIEGTRDSKQLQRLQMMIDKLDMLIKIEKSI